MLKFLNNLLNMKGTSRMQNPWLEHPVVISLPGRTMKLEGFMKRISEAAPGIAPMVFPACTPPANTAINPKSFLGRHPRGAWGCLLSHMGVARTAATLGWETVLVMEDDAAFDSGFLEKVEAAMKEVPEDWDIVFLGSSRAFDQVPVARGIVTASVIHGTHCYLLRKKGYSRFIDMCQEHSKPIDVLMGGERKLNVYTAVPAISWQEVGVESDIDPVVRNVLDRTVSQHAGMVERSPGDGETVVLKGGLGNQMFQMALAMSLRARGRNPWLKMVLSDHGQDARKIFQTGLLPSKPDEGKSILISDQSFPFVYNPGVLSTPYRCKFDGYWQSPKYFAGAEEEIRKTFRIPHTLSTRYEELIRIARQPNAVSIHFRFGDYVNHPLYSVIKPNYYQEAINRMRKEIDRPVFMVFSDDMGKCSQTLRGKDFVMAGGYGSAWEDMMLMSLCRNFIVANSTFSWWGAWLGEEGGKVIAPAPWTSKSEWTGSCDIYPEGWTRFCPETGQEAI